MSSGELRVDSTDVAAVAQFADDIASRLVDRYLQTSEEVSALLDGKWKGSAAEACSQAWQEWSDGFRLVVAGLRDESAALQEAAAQYVSTDADGAAKIAEV